MNLQEAREASTESRETQEFLKQVDALLSGLKDAETGQRGYLLTGEPEYLRPYTASLSAVDQSLRALGRLAVDVPVQRGRIFRLSTLVPAKLAELQETIRLRDTVGQEAALAVMRTDRGRTEMDEIRRVCAEISKREYSRMDERANLAEAHQYRAGVIAATGTALLFILIAAGVIIQDRGARRREELTQAVERSRQLLATTLSSIGDGVIATDAACRVTFLNPVAESLTGYSGAEANGRPLREVFRIIQEGTRQDAEDPAEKVIRLRAVVGFANHTILVRKDGSEIPIDDSGAPIRGRDGAIAGVVLVFRDVTDRRSSEKALEDNEARLRLALEAGGAGTFDWDLVSDHSVWSAGHFTLFGLQPNAVEPSHAVWSDRVHPDDLNRVEREMQDCIEGKAPYRSEYRVISDDGSVHWLHARGQCLNSAAGTPERVIGAVVDVTERKQAEESLVRLNEELELFAYAASHDLQEPLRSVMSCTELLARNYQSKLDPAGQELIQFILGGAVRMRTLIQDLLALSRIGTSENAALQPVAMDDVLHSTLTAIKTAVDESHAQVRAEHLPRVGGDAAQLSQLLQNLLTNAIKYGRPGVPPEIRVWAERDGAMWRMGVRDNGQGFAMEEAQLIFRPFKRLHGREVPGTGIGLAICKRIVERHSGRIWAESTPGEGATFFFTLLRV